MFATLGDSKKPGLVLSGHTDVVPTDGQNWDTDPFIATEKDAKLYARGSADMKGFIGISLAKAPAVPGGAERQPPGCAFALLRSAMTRRWVASGVRGLIRDLEENGIPSGGLPGGRTHLHAAHHRA